MRIPIETGPGIVRLLWSTGAGVICRGACPDGQCHTTLKRVHIVLQAQMSVICVCVGSGAEHLSHSKQKHSVVSKQITGVMVVCGIAFGGLAALQFYLKKTLQGSTGIYVT